MIRAFIAIEITDVIRTDLANVQNTLKQMQFEARVSWTKLENIHLTLQFLGNVEKERIDKIANNLADVSTGFQAFDLEAQGIGCFPNNQKPRVLWVGCQDPSGNLQELAVAIREALLPLGFDPDQRDFAAHLTLGRIKYPRLDVSLTKAISSFRNHTFGMMRVDSIHLFQSQLHSSGAIYTKLSTHRLSESP